MPGARRAFRSVDRRVSRWTLRGPRTHGTDDRATRGSRLDVRYGRHLVFAGVVRPDRTVLVIVAAVVWVGCSRLASKEEERTGREFLAHVARGEPGPRPDHRRQSSTDDTSRSWSRPGLDQPYPRADGYAHRAGAAVAGATEP